MTNSHEPQILTVDSMYLGRLDPATRMPFRVGDNVLVCSKTSDIFLSSSLVATEYYCPFCWERVRGPESSGIGAYKNSPNNKTEYHSHKPIKRITWWEKVIRRLAGDSSTDAPPPEYKKRR